MKPLKVALAIGIAILLPMLAEMTVQIWAEPPKYENYYEPYDKQPKTEAESNKANAEWKQKKARMEKEQEQFNLQQFLVAFPLGVLEIIAGFALRRKGVLSAGLIFGGLASISCASYGSWETLPGWARYVSLLFILLLLGWLALRLDRADVPRPVVASVG